MIVYDYNIDVIPGGVPLVIHVTQYSDNFSVVLHLYSSTGTLSISSGSTGEVSGTKTDGTGYSAEAQVDTTNNTVTIAGDNQITAVAGNQKFRVAVKNDGHELYSANFIFDVQRAALDLDTIPSETKLRELFDITGEEIDAVIAAGETARVNAELSESWAVGGTGARTEEDTNNSKYWAEQAAYAVSRKLTQSALAPEYDSTATYAVGDFCTYNGLLYKCTAAITTAEEWTAAHWTETTVEEAFGGSDTFVATYGVTTSAEIEAAYQAGKEIVCKYNNLILRLTTRISPIIHKFSLAMIGMSNTVLIGSIDCTADVWRDYTSKYLATTTSPSFDGTPTAPTASAGTNTTQIATTAFVKTNLTGKQDTLTFDSSPTAGSSNPVTSGGVREALDTVTGDVADLKSVSVRYRGILNTTTVTPDTVTDIGYWAVASSVANQLFGVTIAGTFFNLRQPPYDFLQMFITTKGEVYCRYQKTGAFVSYNDFTRGNLDDPDTTTAPGFYYSNGTTTRQYTGVSTQSAFLNMATDGGTVYLQAFILPGGVVYSRYSRSGPFTTFTPAIPHRQAVFAPQNPLEFSTSNGYISVTIRAGYYVMPEYSLGANVLSEDITVSQTDTSVYQYVVLNAGTKTFSLKGRNDSLALDDIVLLAFYGSEILNISVESSKFPRTKTDSVKSINDFFAGMFNRTGTPFKIVLGGDSITHGVGGTGFSQNGETIIGNYKRNPDGYCWANLFKSYIEANYNASVLNNGVTGTYSWWWDGYKSTLIPADTDLFILTLGTNQRIKSEGRNGTTHDEQIANYYTQMKSIVDYCATINVPVLLCSSIPATAANEEQTSGGEALYPSHVFEYNGVLQRLASEYNMAYFNLYDAIYYYVRQNDLNLSTLLPDGLHPNDEMYRIMFYEYLKGFNLAPSYVPVELPNQGG